jgi:hypothetical protein
MASIKVIQCDVCGAARDWISYDTKASVVDQGDRQALHVTPMLLFAS